LIPSLSQKDPSLVV